jgi:hypothetical protein
MKIAVLRHRHDDFDRTRYMVKEFADIWRGQGHRVEFRRGPTGPIDADLAIAHIDLTHVPAEYQAWFDGCERVVNRRVVDVSKRFISQNAVSRGDGYEGPVIVKTDRNFGGLREYRMGGRLGGLRNRIDQARFILPWMFRSRMRLGDYRIYPSVRDVPWPVWHNDALFVERFLPEREAENYAMRVWVFFGSRETHSRVVSPHPVVKGKDLIRIDPLGDVPEALRRRREELGFDFGKFDYALVDDRVVLYDANPTPGMPFESERYRPRALHLAAGLGAWM